MHEDSKVTITERRDYIEVTWMGSDDRLRGVAFDKTSSPGNLLRLSVDSGRSKREILFDGMPQYAIHTAEETYEFGRNTIGWQKQPHPVRARLTFAEMEAGPLRGSLEYTFYAGTNFFTEAFRLRTKKKLVVERIEHGWRTFRIGSDNTFSSVHWHDAIEGKDETYLFASEGRRMDLDHERHRFVYLAPADESLGLGMMLPSHYWHEGHPFFEDRNDWTGLVGCVLYRIRSGVGPIRFERGVEKRLLTLYYVGTEGVAEDTRRIRAFTNEETYRKLDGYKVMMQHLHTHPETQEGTPQLPGCEAYLKAFGIDVGFWAEHDCYMKDSDWELYQYQAETISDEEFLAVPGIEISTTEGCEQVGGTLPGHGNYITPDPVLHRGSRYTEWHSESERIPEDGCLDAVAAKVVREGGVMWRNHNGDLDAARLIEGWTQDLKLFEINSRYEFHYKRERANKFDENFAEEIFNRYDALLNAGYRVYLIGGTDFHGAKGYPKNSPLFFQTGIVNYVRMSELSIEALIDSLEAGRLFLTTGEILVTHYSLSGTEVGEDFSEAQGQDSFTTGDQSEQSVMVGLSWTFPLREVRVYTDAGLSARIEPEENRAFGEDRFFIPLNVTDRRWVRVEIRDIANNHAFTQPIFIETTQVKVKVEAEVETFQPRPS